MFEEKRNSGSEVGLSSKEIATLPSSIIWLFLTQNYVQFLLIGYPQKQNEVSRVNRVFFIVVYICLTHV